VERSFALARAEAVRMPEGFGILTNGMLAKVTTPNGRNLVSSEDARSVLRARSRETIERTHVGIVDAEILA